MEYVNLGRTGLKISQYIVGCDNYGDQTEESTALRMMAAAAHAGVNTFDTANSYVGGRSEEIVGKFLKGRRDDRGLGSGTFRHQRKQGFNLPLRRALPGDPRQQTEQVLPAIRADSLEAHPSTAEGHWVLGEGGIQRQAYPRVITVLRGDP